MRKGYPSLMLAGVLFGTIVFGGKILSGLGLTLYELAVLPYLVPVIILLPVILLNKRYWLKLDQLPIWLLYGLICAVTVISQFGSPMLGVPVSVVVLLLYSQPIWTLVFSIIFLKEKVRPKELIACATVIIGVIILINPFNDRITNIAGLMLALLGGVGLAGWLVVGSYASKKGIHPLTTKFAECIFQILFLIIMIPLVNFAFRDPRVTSFTWDYGWVVIVGIVLFGLFSQTLAHLLYFIGVKTVPTMHASIIALLEPVVAVLLSAIFLHELITLNIVIGGLLIIGANVLVIKE